MKYKGKSASKYTTKSNPIGDCKQPIGKKTSATKVAMTKY